MTQLTVATTVKAPIDKVRTAYITPADIMQRNFASDDRCCPAVTNDFRVGGKNNTRMEAKDGSFGFDFITVYDEIIEHEKIASTMEDGRKMITAFQADGESTVVTTVFDAEGQNPVEMQQAGRQAILDNFKKYLESR